MNAFRSLQRRTNMSQEVRPAFDKMRSVYGVHFENAPHSDDDRPRKPAYRPSPLFKPMVREWSFWEAHYDMIVLVGVMSLVGILLISLVRVTMHTV